MEFGSSVVAGFIGDTRADSAPLFDSDATAEARRGVGRADCGLTLSTGLGLLPDLGMETPRREREEESTLYLPTPGDSITDAFVP